MSGDMGAYLLYMVLLLVLVGSALVSRRLPMGKTLKMALAWVAIFALGFAIFSFRSEFIGGGQQAEGRSDRDSDPVWRGAAHPNGGRRPFLGRGLAQWP